MLPSRQIRKASRTLKDRRAAPRLTRNSGEMLFASSNMLQNFREEFIPFENGSAIGDIELLR